jgi:hypothetical protein
LQEENAIRKAATSRVAPRNFQRLDGNICRKNFGMRQLVRERHSDASRTGTHIGDLECWTWETGHHIDLDPARSESFKSNFDDMFCFRARDQNRRRNFKFKPPEFLLAGEVLRRFPGSTTRDQREITIDGRWLERVFWMGVNPSAVALQDVHEKQFSGKRM